MDGSILVTVHNNTQIMRQIQRCVHVAELFSRMKKRPNSIINQNIYLNESHTHTHTCKSYLSEMSNNVYVTKL